MVVSATVALRVNLCVVRVKRNLSSHLPSVTFRRLVSVIAEMYDICRSQIDHLLDRLVAKFNGHP